MCEVDQKNMAIFTVLTLIKDGFKEEGEKNHMRGRSEYFNITIFQV